MSQSLSNILLHIVFSTKNREPLILDEIESRLHQYLQEICKDSGCPAIVSNGMADHIHILVSLSRTISASELVSKLKSNSSRWIKTIDKRYESFSWQTGYGIFSLGESNRQSAIQYILNQKDHHKTVSFKEEFKVLLEKYRVSFDEKYLWD